MVCAIVLFCYLGLQVGLDLFDHFGIFLVGQLLQTGIHREDAAPLIFVLILGHEVEVQMTAGIAISAVIDLVGVKGGVDGLGSAVDVSEESVAVFIADVHDFTDVILVSHDAAAGMALLLEQVQRAHAQVANVNAESSKGLAVYAISAIGILHDDDLLNVAFFALVWLCPTT